MFKMFKPCKDRIDSIFYLKTPEIIYDKVMAIIIF
jgi:hypothetical protein